MVVSIHPDPAGAGRTVENITYLCSKVHIENEGTAGSMCYTEFQNGREIEVCVCESRAGMQPCNVADRLSSGALFVRLLAVAAIAGVVRR